MNIPSALVSILSPFILSSTRCSSASTPMHPSDGSSQGRHLFHLAKASNLSSFHGTFGSNTCCSWPSLLQMLSSLDFHNTPPFCGFLPSPNSLFLLNNLCWTHLLFKWHVQGLFFVSFAFPVHILSSERDSSLRTLNITRIVDWLSTLPPQLSLALSSGILKSYPITHPDIWSVYQISIWRKTRDSFLPQ